MPDTEAASARRNWYLASLGIVRYVPREEMAAAESAAGVDVSGAGAGENALSENAYHEGARHKAVSPMGTGAATAAAVRQVLDDIGGGSPNSSALERRGSGHPPVEPGDSATVAESVGESAEPFLCRIGFWQPGLRVAVLSAMPPGQRPTPVQITMLTNLLKAIGALGQGLPAVDLIDWPPSSGLGLRDGASLAAARDYLGVFLQARQRQRHFETVLLMGDIAARICGDNEAFAAGRRLELPWGARGIITHSLHDMEKTPALKAETWQAIRFLAG